MIGRTPGYIVAVRPLRQGAITDFDITQRMIRLLLQRAGRQPVQPAPGSHLRALGHHRGGAARRHRGGPPGRRGRGPAHRAAHGGAIGAGLPINEPVGNMVVDIGGGTSETAPIAIRN